RVAHRHGGDDTGRMGKERRHEIGRFERQGQRAIASE
ncbi:MAG: hypothetical protein ACJA1R_003118, partial [Flavobacteriales bacterium]